MRLYQAILYPIPCSNEIAVLADEDIVSQQKFVVARNVRDAVRSLEVEMNLDDFDLYELKLVGCDRQNLILTDLLGQPA